MAHKTELMIDRILVQSAAMPNPTENFVTTTGFYGVLSEAFSVAGDLYDVIELCRANKLYAASDRLRTLQNRLFEAAEPLHNIMPQPCRADILRLIERQSGAKDEV